MKHDTVLVERVDVEFSITQKCYADSTYTAWTSGYNQSLDGIHIYLRKEIVTIGVQLWYDVQGVATVCGSECKVMVEKK